MLSLKLFVASVVLLLHSCRGNFHQNRKEIDEEMRAFDFFRSPAQAVVSMNGLTGIQYKDFEQHYDGNFKDHDSDDMRVKGDTHNEKRDKHGLKYSEPELKQAVSLFDTNPDYKQVVQHSKYHGYDDKPKADKKETKHHDHAPAESKKSKSSSSSEKKHGECTFGACCIVG